MSDDRPLVTGLKIPDGSFKAYLFDCDGTIADSMPLHYVAWNKALKEWNCEFDEDLFYAWGNMLWPRSLPPSIKNMD